MAQSIGHYVMIIFGQILRDYPVIFFFPEGYIRKEVKRDSGILHLSACKLYDYDEFSLIMWLKKLHQSQGNHLLTLG